MKMFVLAAALILFGVTGIHHPASAEEEWEPASFNAKELNSLLEAVPGEGSLLLELRFTPYRAQGKLYGCGYAFHVLLRDWAYRENQPAVVYGSVVYFKEEGRLPALSLRLGINDIRIQQGVVERRDAAVEYAYLRWSEESTAELEPIVVDGERSARSFTYQDPEARLIEALVLADPLTVAFNRKAAGTDLEFELPVMYEDAWMENGVCLRELAGF
ncbi:hypothetical protein ACM26W_06525 [Halomonas sp. HK25]|uniref:hypothetical protein n=1 Tax=Halomonas sp. HK25 TaxID=3394321 RepID=UPI0039FDE14B